MKKIIKIIIYLALIIIIGWLGVMFFAHYVFTKKHTLSCDGNWEETTVIGNDVTEAKRKATESLRIEIIKYPFSEPFFFIHANNDLFTSSSHGEHHHISQITEHQIIVGDRWNNPNGFDMKGFTFDRISRVATWENRSEDRKLNISKISVFTGLCTEVKPL